MELDVINIKKEIVGKVEVPKAIVDSRFNEAMIHGLVVTHLSNLRRGTHASKTRAMVSGGGKKPWRQKGNGGARAGSSRSPIWRGGGVAFGPAPRDYSKKSNKKCFKNALKQVISRKIKEESFVVIDDIKIDKPKTKTVKSIINAVGLERSVLIVIDSENSNLNLSVRNLQGIKTQRVDSLNIYDLLKYNTLLCTESAYKKIEDKIVI